MIVDMRHLQKPGGPDPKCGRLDKSGGLVLRDPATVTTLVLHQTAVRRFGVKRSDLAAENGNETRARWRRAIGVHAHVTAFTDGAVVPAYPLRAFVWHGNGSNASSVGLEVEGLYNGLPGGKNDEPDELTIATAREAVAWIVAEAAREGMAIGRLVAHRQYSPSRQADPGWMLWRDVALWAERHLGMTLDSAFAEKGGRPIPSAWDPRSKESY